MLSIEEITEITTRFRASQIASDLQRQSALADYLWLSGGKPYKRPMWDKLKSWVGQRFLAIAHWLGEYD